MGQIKGSISSLENFFSKGLEKPPNDNLLEKSKSKKGKNTLSGLFN